jgi:hypothetical protein
METQQFILWLLCGAWFSSRISVDMVAIKLIFIVIKQLAEPFSHVADDYFNSNSKVVYFVKLSLHCSS